MRTPNPALFRRYILPTLTAEEKPVIYPREYFYPALALDGSADIGPETPTVHLLRLDK